MKGIQTYRNPWLVHLFDKLGHVENFGTRIPRTFSNYQKYMQKPNFEATNNFFIVTLPNVNYANDQINDIGLLILKIIKLHPGSSVPTIYKYAKDEFESITLDKIRNEIQRKLTPYIIHKGSNKTGGYFLK